MILLGVIFVMKVRQMLATFWVFRARVVTHPLAVPYWSPEAGKVNTENWQFSQKLIFCCLMSILSRFLSLFNGGMRAYKIQDSQRLRRIGITAKTFKELLSKGCEKLQV